MAELHGNLLIGGMTLKNVLARLAEDSPPPGAKWRGELLIEPEQTRNLELGRPYRLELEDGRAGKIAITRIDNLDGQLKMQATFDGLSALEGARPTAQRNQPVEASR